MDVVALAQFGVGYAVASAPRPRRSTSRAVAARRRAGVLLRRRCRRAQGGLARARSEPAARPDHKPIRFLFLPRARTRTPMSASTARRSRRACASRDPVAVPALAAALRGRSRHARRPRTAGLVSKSHIQKITAPALRCSSPTRSPSSPASRKPTSGRCSSSRVARPLPGRLRVLLVTTRRLAGMELADRAAQRPDARRAHRPGAARPRPRGDPGAARDPAVRSPEEELSFPLLMDALSGNPALKRCSEPRDMRGRPRVRRRRGAQRVPACADADRSRHRKMELDDLRKRLSSREDLVAFNEKNLAYKRLQGALPSA